MEALAKELRTEIDWICIDYHYRKQTDIIEKVKKIQGKIEQYLSFFLQGNVFGLNEEEYKTLTQYVLQVLKDYSEAMENCDMVLMTDTLEWGFRELLNLVIEEGSEEVVNE